MNKGNKALICYQEALTSVANQQETAVSTIDPAYTSQTCSRCGARKKSYRNGALFTCGKCGHTVNADRNASVNIARKLLSERLQGTAVAIGPEKARSPREMAQSTATRGWLTRYIGRCSLELAIVDRELGHVKESNAAAGECKMYLESQGSKHLLKKLEDLGF